MPKYVVTTTATAVWNIIVEAESREEARDLVLEGDYNEEYNNVDQYINEEIYDIREID
jgi:hypothetical protein